MVDGIPMRDQNDAGTTPEYCVQTGGYEGWEVRDMLCPWNITAVKFVWDGNCLWEARRLLSETNC